VLRTGSGLSPSHNLENNKPCLIPTKRLYDVKGGVEPYYKLKSIKINRGSTNKSVPPRFAFFKINFFKFFIRDGPSVEMAQVPLPR